MKRRVLFLLLLVCLLFFLFFLMNSSGGYLKTTSAELFVNGKPIDTPAVVFWYNIEGGGPAHIQFPFLSTLESLGCQIEGEEPSPGSEVVILVGDRKFIVKRHDYSSDLFMEDGYKVYSGVASPFDWSRFRDIRKGSLYLDERDCVRVLSVFGFNHVSYEISEDARTVRLTAIVLGDYA